MSYVYKKCVRPGEISETVYAVGFYAPEGTWHLDGEYSDPAKAAERVHYLNGGQSELERRELRGHMRAMEQLTLAIRNMPHTVRMRP